MQMLVPALSEVSPKDWPPALRHICSRWHHTVTREEMTEAQKEPVPCSPTHLKEHTESPRNVPLAFQSPAWRKRAQQSTLYINAVHAQEARGLPPPNRSLPRTGMVPNTPGQSMGTDLPQRQDASDPPPSQTEDIPVPHAGPEGILPVGRVQRSPGGIGHEQAPERDSTPTAEAPAQGGKHLHIETQQAPILVHSPVTNIVENRDGVLERWDSSSEVEKDEGGGVNSSDHLLHNLFHDPTNRSSDEEAVFGDQTPDEGAESRSRHSNTRDGDIMHDLDRELMARNTPLSVPGDYQEDDDGSSGTSHALPQESHGADLHVVPGQSAEPSGIVDHSINTDTRKKNPHGQARRRIWGLAAATQVEEQPYPPSPST